MSKLQDQTDGFALIQMYQSGFLDGYNAKAMLKVDFPKIGEKCKKSFELRYMNKKMQKKINKERKK